MLSGVPNYFLSFGYTNASWTLRSDVTAKSVCRLLNHMKAGGYTVCTPRLPDNGMERRPVITFTSGYVQRALPFLPKQGTRQPWIVPQNYVKDRFAMRFGRIDEDLELRRNGTAVRA
jgi:monooxygenase